MSSRLPDTTARRAPENVGVLLREPFLALTEQVHERLAEAGYPEIRPAHGTVFQFLDDEGTRVSVLAERAQMTKQSMAELVAHLEAHGYVERVPDPSDRRAKLVRATRRGRQSPAFSSSRRLRSRRIFASPRRSVQRASMSAMAARATG